MALHKLQNAIARISPKFFVLAWSFQALAFLGQMNLSGIAFLFHLQPLPPDQPRPILATAELVRSVLSGWVFFTVFLKPGTRTILPDKSVKRDFVTLTSMVFQLLYPQLWLLLLADVGQRLQTQNERVFLPDWGLMAISVALVVWTITKLIHWKRKQERERKELEHIPDLSAQARSLEKIRKHLNEQQQNELKTLIYEESSAMSVSIQNIVWIALFFVVTSFLFEILQELFARF